MYLKKILIFILLISPISFATNSHFLAEREEMERRVNQVSQILVSIINTGKSIDDMSDEERKFLKEYNIDITRPIQSISYAYAMKDRNDNLIKMDVKSEPIYFPYDVDFKYLNLPDRYKIKLFFCSDEKYVYEGYVALIYEHISSTTENRSVVPKNKSGKKNSMILDDNQVNNSAVSKTGSAQDIKLIQHAVKLDTTEDDRNEEPKEIKKKLKIKSIKKIIFRKKPK